MRSGALAALTLAVLGLVPATAAAAPDLDGFSGPRALRTVDLAGRWSFDPNDGAPTTIELPGGGWVKQGHLNTVEATYARRVAVPDVGPGQVVRLELGALKHEVTPYVDGLRVRSEERRVGEECSSRW